MSTTEGPLRIDSLREAGQCGVAARQTELPRTARQVHRAVLSAFLATGQAPHCDDLVLPEGISAAEDFGRLDEVDLVHFDHGRVAVAYPFSGSPTAHLVRLDDGAPVYAMCAIDALGIPLMTGRDGVIESVDPDDGQPVRVARRGASWHWSPEETVVVLAQSRGAGPAADCVCPTVTFHADRCRAEKYLRGHTELAGLVLDQAQAIQIADREFGPLLAAAPGQDTAARGTEDRR